MSNHITAATQTLFTVCRAAWVGLAFAAAGDCALRATASMTNLMEAFDFNRWQWLITIAIAGAVELVWAIQAFQDGLRKTLRMTVLKVESA